MWPFFCLFSELFLNWQTCIQGTGNKTIPIKHPATEFLTSHSLLSETKGVLYHSVQSWHHMEDDSRLEIESSGTHLSCWAQMHCCPHTVWLIATVHSHTTHSHECTYVRVHMRTRSLSHFPPLPPRSRRVMWASEKLRPLSGLTTVHRMLPQSGGHS